ncbi:MAG: RyR domain-containing protein [Pseudomonadota bacterium]
MISDLEAISRAVHEGVRAWSAAHGQADIPAWDKAPDWMKASTQESVQFVQANPQADAGAQHEQWMAQRLADGWTYGETRDDDAKHHPMLVPFEDLPEFEKKKDALVCAIVLALS